MTESWSLLVIIVPIAVDVMDVRLLFAGIKDLASYLAFDRIQPCVLPCAAEECEPLIGVISFGDVVVPNLGFSVGSRVNGTLADVADDAETEALWWNEDRHLLRDQLRDEMGRDAADYVGGWYRIYTGRVQTPHTRSAIQTIRSCVARIPRTKRDFRPFDKV